MKPRPARSPKVVPFPVLTLKAIRKANDWEPALTLPIAPNTSAKTLIWVRMMVTAYRKYWQETAASELLAEGMDDQWMNTQIRRASVRLTEIENALCVARAAETEARRKRREKQEAPASVLPAQPP